MSFKATPFFCIRWIVFYVASASSTLTQVPIWTAATALCVKAKSLNAFNFNDIALKFGIPYYNIIRCLSTLYSSCARIPSLFFPISRFRKPFSIILRRHFNGFAVPWYSIVYNPPCLQHASLSQTKFRIDTKSKKRSLDWLSFNHILRNIYNFSYVSNNYNKINYLLLF